MQIYVPRRSSADARAAHVRRPPSSRNLSELAAPRVIVIGGDDRTQTLEEFLDGLRTFPSARFAGAGSISRALAVISSGTADLVVVLCRWIGHSDYYAIAERCRLAGVRLVRVRGGFSAARRAIDDALGER